MIDPFEYPDEVLWELSDPNYDYDLAEESAFHSKGLGVCENSEGEGADYSSSEFDRLDILGDFKSYEELKDYQKYLSRFYEENYPSKVTKVYWIYVQSNKKYRKSTKFSGKWLLFIPEEHIDAAWDQVKDATEKGLLGGSSKVSTKLGYRGSEYVICVHTYNWKDEYDVIRIRENLRDLGFEKPIPYKTDEDTIKRKYAKNGDKNLAKYYI